MTIVRISSAQFVSAEHLAGLLAAAPSVSELATQSYKHPNGFVKIPLVRGADGSSTRLHYWPEATSADGNIHSHRWDMTSHILHGRYKAIDFEETEGGLPVQKYACSENAQGAYQLTGLGQTTLRQITKHDYGSGCAYEMPAGKIHRVISVVSPPVLSLVVCSRPRSVESFIYSQKGMAPANPPAEAVPVELIEDLLRWARSLNDAAPSSRF